jgi:glycolate oxidase FAD binding subunit
MAHTEDEVEALPTGRADGTHRAGGTNPTDGTDRRGGTDRTDDASGAAHASGESERALPESLAEAADVLASADADRRTVLLRGGGTALDWGGPVTNTDLVVETGGLDRLVGHAAEDWTVTVEAGMELRRLQRLLAPAGQWLPLDPPAAAAGATLGGLLASGEAGPLRLSSGGLGDLTIGALVLPADGSVVRTGGEVIKNVAGYDLAKLFTGSLGAYGLVGQLTLRVHPLPEASATLAVPSEDAADALAAARAVAASPLGPAAVEWDGQRLLVRFHGTADGTAARVRRAAELPALAPARVLDRDAEEAAWREYAALVEGEDGDTVLRAGAHPAQLPALDAALSDAARRYGVRARLTAGAAAGVCTARLRGGGPEAHAGCLTEWRRAVRDAGGTAVLRRRAQDVDRFADAWGPAPGTVGVLRALKRQFDPGGRLAPGRFAPWL